jgi:hypothetical protein
MEREEDKNKVKCKKLKKKKYKNTRLIKKSALHPHFASIIHSSKER